MPETVFSCILCVIKELSFRLFTALSIDYYPDQWFQMFGVLYQTPNEPRCDWDCNKSPFCKEAIDNHAWHDFSEILLFAQFSGLTENQIMPCLSYLMLVPVFFTISV